MDVGVELPCHGEKSIQTPNIDSLLLLLVICFWREAPETAVGPDLRAGKRGMILERDGGICQYTGRKLAPGEGNIDHVLPRSRGGAWSWENCVLSHRSLNEKKADRLPHEAGLRLLRKPHTPHALPATMTIRNLHGIRDWQCFLAPFTGHAA
jgi:hypothetical protein